MTAATVQVNALAGRSVLRTLRQPAMIVPSIIFPLFLFAVNSSGLNAATQIPMPMAISTGIYRTASRQLP